MDSTVEHNNLDTKQPAGKKPWWRQAKWLIVGGILFILFILPMIVALVMLPMHKNSPQQQSSKLPDIALPAGATVDTAHLPSSKQLFFTMLQRTASQPVIAGYYAEGYYDDSSGNPLIGYKYQMRSAHWTNGKVSYDYADVPWDPSGTGGLSLIRCVNGVFNSYADYAPTWKGSPGSSEADCHSTDQIQAGYANIDDIVAGGLTKNQATVWVDELAASKDSNTQQPLFSFDAPTLTDVDGKKVIAINFHINKVFDKTFCNFACGMSIIKQALVRLHISTDDIGYPLSSMGDTATGTYYIDPLTLLPVRSQVDTTINGKLGDSYRKQFQFTQPDFSATPTSIPASVPEIAQGFTPLSDPLPPPSGQ